ncbi:MAG: hypothetical protein RL172_2690 [Bacteroidota bacterium]|jgi:uncharacterized membrane protein
MKQLINKHIFFYGIAFCGISLLGSCYYDKEALLYPGNNSIDCTTVSAKFSSNVQPLITSKCATSSCHDASAAGGIILLNYTQVSNAKERINTRVVVEKTMPPSGALSPAEIAILKCWIDAGAPNN